MKKLFFALLAVAAIGLTSCEKVLDAFLDPIESPLAVTVTIPVTTNITSEASLGSSSVRFNLDSIIRKASNDVFNVSNIKSVKIKDMAISLQNATQTNNLANFESARITFHTNTNTSPVTIGTASIPDAYATNLIIPISNSIELKEYLNGTLMSFNLYGKARRATTAPLEARISITLRSE